MQPFKIRASAAGKLMTNPTAAAAKTGAVLSETSKSYIKEWLIEQIYGYPKDISSKYIERGIEQEDAAIDFAIQTLDLPFALKNENYFEDDHFTGTPDLIVDGCVYDIKCSWSAHTFPAFEEEIPTKDYYFQLQVYMHLTGMKKACLTYVLLDNEAIGHKYQVEDKMRIKTFDIDFDQSVIDTLIERVKAGREYIELLIGASHK